MLGLHIGVLDFLINYNPHYNKGYTNEYWINQKCHEGIFLAEISRLNILEPDADVDALTEI